MKVPRGRAPSAGFHLADLFAAQRDRAILWAPIAVVVGAALYFTAPGAPLLWAGPAAAALGGCAAFGAFSWAPTPAWRPARVITIAVALGTACLGLGYGAGALRELAVAAPRISTETPPVIVEGWVTDLSQGATRPRLTIRVHTVEGLKAPPLYVRVSTTQAGALPPGRGVRCRAVLHRPDGPLAPGGYDSAYDLYFKRVGGVGFSFGPCRPAEINRPLDLGERIHLRVTAVRRAITESIFDAAPGRGGASAAALITGDTSGIERSTMDVFRASGLAHLLAVSGFNMSLVAGMIFGAAHMLLALLPGFALRFPIRKWAAGAAIFGGTIYLVMSGMSVPAVRAYVMTLVALTAILIDRPAITMRSLAVSALFVTLTAPEAVLTPGYQMSFAATATLVAAFEFYTARAPSPLPSPGLLVGALQSAWRWTAGALTASLVAGLATDPFALAHFQRLSIYALPANLAATPIISLVVTPAAAAAGALAPLGLAEPALRVMAWGLELIIAIGGAFAGRAEALLTLPAPPAAAVAAWALAIAWASLWRGPLRWGGGAIFAAGVLVYAAAPRPVLLIDGRGQALIARDGTPGGPAWIAIAPKGGGAFARERLGGLAGLGAAEAASLAAPLRCGDRLCAWLTPRQRPVAVVADHAGFEAQCTPHAIIIARFDLPPTGSGGCRPAALLTPSDLARYGGAALYESKAGVSLRRVYRPGPLRVWAGGAAMDSDE